MTKNVKPALIGSIVTVDKKFGREVLVGVTDANNIVTHGFDIDVANPANAFFADIHYRMARHGTFSVLVGTAAPVEVRVMLDGKLLAEKRLDPRPQSLHDRNDSPVVRQVKDSARQPQPFFINTANDGSSMQFTADPLKRSADERVRMQLHPNRLTPVSGAAVVRVDEEPTDIFTSKMDVDPAEVFGQKPAPTPAKPDGHALSATSDSAATTDAVAASASPDAGSAQPVTQTDATAPTANAPASVVVAAQASGTESVQSLPLPEKWGESHGLVAVGVRMVQVAIEGEPLMPPDGFTYVLFQLNTWEDHARIRAHLHSRVKLPKMTPYKEFLDDPEPVPHPVGCACGKNHNFDPRRFR
jgi:hypothetical protein